jgi:hypothetical protein
MQQNKMLQHFFFNKVFFCDIIFKRESNALFLNSMTFKELKNKIALNDRQKNN